MKKTLLILSTLAICKVLSAQTTGTITYLETSKIEIHVDGISEEMQAMLPKERTVKSELKFNQKNALVKNLKSNENSDIDQDINGARVVIKQSEPDNKTFFDLTANKIIDQKEFMERVFLIESDLKSQTWKITGQQKEILGYACLEAELTNSITKNKIKAWFCPTISVPVGPMALGNLPGIILAVDINDGKTSIVAQKIDLSAVNENELIKPKDGKKVSKKEFNEIVEAKQKEMKEQYGGEGNVIIKVRP